MAELEPLVGHTLALEQRQRARERLDERALARAVRPPHDHPHPRRQLHVHARRHRNRRRRLVATAAARRPPERRAAQRDGRLAARRRRRELEVRPAVAQALRAIGAVAVRRRAPEQAAAARAVLERGAGARGGRAALALGGAVGGLERRGRAAVTRRR